MGPTLDGHRLSRKKGFWPYTTLRNRASAEEDWPRDLDYSAQGVQGVAKLFCKRCSTGTDGVGRREVATLPREAEDGFGQVQRTAA